MTMFAFEDWLKPSDRLAQIADPALRILTSLIFIIGGLGHYGQHDVMLARMEESPWRDLVEKIGDPSVLLWMSGAVFIVFGVLLAFGFLTRLSAILIFATLVPITITTHIAPGHVGPLFKNIAIMGALFFIFCRGSGAYAIDNILRRDG